MPRRLPRLDRKFSSQVDLALGLVRRMELAFTSREKLLDSSGQFTPSDTLKIFDIELAYELAYLRAFLAWEVLLENVLTRLMCGFAHSQGQETLKPGKTYQKRIIDAEAILLNGRDYLLWHNPDHVVNRASKIFNNSNYETVIQSARTRIIHLSAIRHRIVHSQVDAATKFDQASMLITGRRYPGSRPGRLLRDTTLVKGVHERWLTVFCGDLQNLSQQICA